MVRCCGAGEMYIAIYDYVPKAAGELAFKKGDSILLTGQSSRYTYAGYVEGTPGTIGSFPSTYVMQPEDFEQMFAEMAAKAPAATLRKKEYNPRARAPRGSLKGTGAGAGAGTGTGKGKGARGIRWREQLCDYAYTYHKEEYARACEFDPQAAYDQWSGGEEKEEQARMLQVRWEYFERDLPAGQKCEERRLADEVEERTREREKAQAMIAAAKKEERRKQFYAARAEKKKMVAKRELAEKWFDLMDLNGNGSIDKDEFDDFCTSHHIDAAQMAKELNIKRTDVKIPKLHFVAVVVSGKLKSVDLASLKVGGPVAKDKAVRVLSRASGECFTPESSGAQGEEEDTWL